MKVIQISYSEGDGESGTLFVLCDDGSLWMLVNPWDEDNRRWRSIRLPQETPQETK